MFALFIIAVVALTAVAATGVLADSGLRWWSAFGQLRRELKFGLREDFSYAVRPAIVEGGCAGFSRSVPARRVTSSVRRAA